MDGGSTNISCTLSGVIDTSIWLSLPNGVVTLTFYSEDLAGNIGTAQVLIYKEGSEPVSSTTTTTTTEPISTEPSSSIPSTSQTTSDPEVSSFSGIALLLMVVCMGIVKIKKRKDIQ